MRQMLVAIIALTLPSMAVGQAYAGQDSNSPHSNRVAAQTAPGVAAANQAVAGQAGTARIVTPGDQAAYAQDLRAYDAARRARRHTISRDQAYYDRHQRAYGMAMADWRAQVDACHHGHSRACNRPAPRPGDYM